MNFFEKLVSYKLCNKAKTVFWWTLFFLIVEIIYVSTGLKSMYWWGRGKGKIKTGIFVDLLFSVILYLLAIFYAEKTCTDKNYPDTPSSIIIIMIIIIILISPVRRLVPRNKQFTADVKNAADQFLEFIESMLEIPAVQPVVGFR